MGGGITMISFIIDGTEYQAEEGMTWETLINNGFEIDTPDYHNIYIASNRVCIVNKNSGWPRMLVLDGVEVLPSDKIYSREYDSKRVD